MKRLLLILALLSASAFAQTLTCGVAYDGSNPGNPPPSYNALPDLSVGIANAQPSVYGCNIWKVADGTIFESAIQDIDVKTRWALLHHITTGDSTYWFGKGGFHVYAIDGSGMVCDINAPYSGDFSWGVRDVVRNASDKWGGANDQDLLYWAPYDSSGLLHAIYRINVAACAAGTKSITSMSSAYVEQWDTLPTYSSTYLSWARTAADISTDGNTICLSGISGSDVIDPRLYNIGTKVVGPALTGGHVGVSAFRSCRINPAIGHENELVVQYQDTAFERFNGTTGAYINTILPSPDSGHGAVVGWGTESYKVQQISGNAGDTAISGCTSNMEMVKISDGTRTCINYAARGVGEFYAWGNGTGDPIVAMSFSDSLGVPTPTFVTADYLNTHTSGTVTVYDAATPGACDGVGGGTGLAYCNYKTSDAWYPLMPSGTMPLGSDWSTHWSQYYSGFRTWSTKAFSNEIFVAFLDGRPPVHIAHHRSIRVEHQLCYNSFGQHACTAYDSLAHIGFRGNYIIFNSTWGPNNNVSTYAIQIMGGSPAPPVVNSTIKVCTH